MSAQNDNTGLIIGALVVLYMMSKSRPQYAAGTGAVPYGGAPASMPASAGSGWSQVAQGALNGFLGAIASGPRNNTSAQVLPSYTDYNDGWRGNVVQEGLDAMNVGGTFAEGWF